MNTFTSTVEDLNLDFTDRQWEVNHRRGSKTMLEFKLQPDTDDSEDDESENEEFDLEDDDEYYFDNRLEFCDYVHKSKDSLTSAAIEICTDCDKDDATLNQQKTSGAIVQNGHVDGIKEIDEEHKLSSVIEESCSISARRNDREEIRKKLAMGEEDDCCDEDEGEDIGYKKPTKQSRLHSGLQICFMNESPGSTDSEGLSPRQHDIHDNLKLMSNTRSLVDSDNNLSTAIDLNSTTATNKTDLDTTTATNVTNFNIISGSTITQIESTSLPRLKIQLDEASTSEEDFQSKQEKLQNEAKMALAQAGTMAHMQLEIERQIKKKKSPMVEMVGIMGLGEGQKKFSLLQLQQMNLAQIQVLYNDLQTQIETLNEELVYLLMERDEQHMEQDSMLVDIEDLTRRAEELASKTNRESRLKSTVKGKLPNR